jgi:hypothetical protein
MSFGGFSYGFDSVAVTSHSHPPLFDSPPLAQTHDDEGEESGNKMKMMSKAYRRPPP